MLIERPWERVKDPTRIPPALSVEMLSAMPAGDFAQLIRDHLLPRQPRGEERERWERLWTLLGTSDELGERAFDVLDEFLDAVEHALEAGALDEQAQRRAQKFSGSCRDAWKRLDVDQGRPLGWAGQLTAAKFNPAARRVIDRLVTAIDAHRREVLRVGSGGGEDDILWQVLQQLNLDPGLLRGLQGAVQAGTDPGLPAAGHPRADRAHG